MSDSFTIDVKNKILKKKKSCLQSWRATLIVSWIHHKEFYDKFKDKYEELKKLDEILKISEFSKCDCMSFLISDDDGF